MSFISFKISEYGLFDSRAKFPEQQKTAERTVGSYEIELYTEDNSGCSYLNGKKTPLNKGRLICAKPGLKRYSTLPFKCFYIHLHTDDKALKALLNSLPDAMMLNNFEELTDILKELAHIQYESSAVYELLLQSYICKFLHIISKYAGQYNNQIQNENQHKTMLLDIAEYIQQHLDEPLSLDFLSKKANLSPIYFHRIFNEYFEKTPNEYVTEQRITAAKQKLAYSDIPLSQIAMECGFTSQSYFNTKFRFFTGQTPLQYRKMMFGRMKL